MSSLPEPHHPGHYTVAFVCLGNICRSPMADVVMQEMLRRHSLEGRVEVRSCGTGDWHLGHAMDERAAAQLTESGYDPSRHRAQQFGPDWLADNDLLLAMDRQNLADIGGRSERVRLFGDFDPDEAGAEVPDPYYGGIGGFQEVLAMVERTTNALATQLRELLDA